MAPSGVTAAIVVVAAIYLAHAIFYWRQINDDAFITFRYAKFLGLGLGPYYNVGEHVEGYTSPLMMFLMAGVDAVLGDTFLPVVAKGVGILGGLATLLFTGLLCSAWLGKLEAFSRTAPALAWLAPALIATQSGFALNSTTGLETTVFTAFIVGGLWLSQAGEDSDRWRGGGVLFALAVLTRPEGAAVFAVVWLAQLLGRGWPDARHRRRLMLDAAVVAGAAAILLTFRWFAYDGEFLPNTYFAKAGGMGAQTTASGYLIRFVRKHLAYAAWVPALFVLTTKQRAILRGAAPALFVVSFGVASIYLAGPDWMPGYRLLAPYLPEWAALCVLGVCVLVAERSNRRRTETAAVCCVALLVVLFVWQAPTRTRYHEDCLVRARGYAEGHTALAEWLKQRAKPGQTVALMDIGIVGFRCIDLRILDVTGLTDRFIAKSPGSFLDKAFDPDYVFNRSPDYVVIAFTAESSQDRRDPGHWIPWSPIERRLVATPQFQSLYVRPRSAPTEAGPEETLAARLGAERVFRHAYPGRSLILCVYPRNSPGREPPA